MGEEDVIDVAQAGETRVNASRSGRASQPPRRLEQELRQIAPTKQGRTTNTAKKATIEAAGNANGTPVEVNDQLFSDSAAPSDPHR